MIPPGALDLLLPQPNAVDLAFRWATVTSVTPLRVRLDGEDAPLPLDLDSLVDPASLRVDDRVRCELGRRRIIIHGTSGLGGLARAVELGANINLNTVCIPGAYIQRSNANTSLALNYPLAEAGLLEVFNISYSATESMLHQRYTRYGTTSGKDIQVWHRRYYATGGGWGPWVPIGGRHETAAPTTGLVNGSGGTFVAMDGLKVNDVYSGRTHCTINAARAAGSNAQTILGVLPAEWRPVGESPWVADNGIVGYVGTTGNIVLGYNPMAIAAGAAIYSKHTFVVAKQ